VNSGLPVANFVELAFDLLLFFKRADLSGRLHSRAIAAVIL
jgi:hypothetical protein